MLKLSLCTVKLMSIVLVGMVISGKTLAEQARLGDCLRCHLMGNAVGTKYPEKMDSQNKTHHPVGIPYPQDVADFNPVNEQSNEESFFDANHNGLADTDEVRMKIVEGAATVTCLSCHREHEQSLAKKSGNSYLRRPIEASELCLACHRK